MLKWLRLLQLLARHARALGEHCRTGENALFSRVEPGRVCWNWYTAGFPRSYSQETPGHSFHIVGKVFAGEVEEAQRDHCVFSYDSFSRLARHGRGFLRVHERRCSL